MKHISDMEKILSLRFQKRQQVFSKVVAEEAKLRAKLAKLAEQERSSDASSEQHIKAIGADVVWKAWLERTRTSLNMELAHVLAQKESLLAAVRKEYGKLLVVRRLRDDHLCAARKQQQSRALNKSIESHFLSH